VENYKKNMPEFPKIDNL